MAQRQGDGLLAFGSRILIEAKLADARVHRISHCFFRWTVACRQGRRLQKTAMCSLTAEDPVAKVLFHVVEFVLDIVVATEILFDVECSRAGRSLFFCARCPVFTSLGGSDVNGGPRPPSDYIYNKNKRKTSPGVWGGCPMTDEDAASAALQ